MQKIVLLFVLGALCTVNGGLLSTGIIATVDLLLKWKQILELLIFVNQPVLPDCSYGVIGNNYDLQGNSLNYSDQDSLNEYLWMYQKGYLLRVDAIFSEYHEKHRRELLLLVKLLISAKNYDTFYNTACWARVRGHSIILVIALKIAVLYRSDCQYIRLPPIYEVCPHYFYDDLVLQTAQDLKMSTSLSVLVTLNAYINGTYSNKHLPPCLAKKYPEDYFREDNAYNAFYFYFRLTLAFWLSSNDVAIPKDIRGDLYFYFYLQIFARYNLERRSHNLCEVKDFDWHKRIKPGYHSLFRHRNGKPVCRRPEHWHIPCHKNRDKDDIIKLEARLAVAIDLGYIIDDLGNQISINSADGLDIIAGLIEGHCDAPNKKYYGMYEALGHEILGGRPRCNDKNDVETSAIENHCTCMKDPGFYLLIKKILSLLIRYKKNLPPYKPTDLTVAGVVITSVVVPPLLTFNDVCVSSIKNIISVESYQTGLSLSLKGRRDCLNHQPFALTLNINALAITNIGIKIFIGPHIDGVYDICDYTCKHWHKFVECDHFAVTLAVGANVIQRQSTDFTWTMPDLASGDDLYNDVLAGIAGTLSVTTYKKYYGFPHRLLLPRGTANGVKIKIFVFAYLYNNTAPVYELPMFGPVCHGGKPIRYPLDRPSEICSGPPSNMILVDALVTE